MNRFPTSVVMLLALLSVAMPLLAQEPESIRNDLPELRHLAASLSDVDSRMDTLMSTVATAHLLEAAPIYSVLEDGALGSRFRDDRAWLDRLATRYATVPMRSAVLDSSAWLLTLELDKHQVTPSSLVSPAGPDTTDLMFQVFDRSDEGLAAASLPELLMRMEFLAPSIWQDVRDRADGDRDFLLQLEDLNNDWFDVWTAAEPPAPTGLEDELDLINQAIDEFEVLAMSAMSEGAQDALRLKRLRFRLLVAIPGMAPHEAKDAAYLLRLLSALDGLEEGSYLSFTETLLWVVTDLLLESQKPFRMSPGVKDTDPFSSSLVIGGPTSVNEAEGSEALVDVEADLQSDLTAETGAGVEADNSLAQQPEPMSRLPRLLSALLPRLSNSFAREFSTVDPLLNANFAAAFDVAQSLQEGLPGDLARQSALLRELADAVVQFALLIPDVNYYVDQPVRTQINDEINACISMVAGAREGSTSLSRDEFDRCVTSMVELAETNARSAELAGDPDGPYGALQLHRELELMPWQRINYTVGYLHEQAPGACALPPRPLVNPLEWSTLATALTWFAQQSPVYFQAPENEALVLSMKQQGIELLQSMKQQVTCFSNHGPGITDPVSMSLSVYRQTLDQLVAGIREAELTFREANLAPGADIVLHGGAEQRTAYRPEGLLIGPCNPENVCEMTGQLEATRALIGLFPDHYLIADQAGLGKAEICYDNVQWVQRRAELVRPDDPNVANYYGRLSFDLIGRFEEEGVKREVFGSNFVSPEDYHYLFAANSEEVLDDSCPTEWVGTKTVTRLNNKTPIRVIPDRLTYLAGARQLPSRILNLNWSRGAEWRDWFVTGLGITAFEFARDEAIMDRLDQHLQTLYQGEQSAMYRALLRPPSRGGVGDPMSLFEETTALTTAKALVRSQISLFYPDYMVDSDSVRQYLQGTQSLVDESVLRRFRESNVAIGTINDTGMSRFESFQSFWDRQPEQIRSSGSSAIPVAHGIARLNALYRQFFKPEEAKGAMPGVRGLGG